MKTKYFFFTLTLLVLLALAGSVNAAASQTVAEPQDGGLMFVENRGQFDLQVRFQAQGDNGTLWVTDDGLWVTVVENLPEPEIAEAPEMGLPEQRAQAERPTRGVALKLSFAGATPQAVEPFELLETEMSYFLGNDPAKWVSGAPVWAGVRYVDLYPGIDLELSGQAGQLALQLVARDDADLGQVRMRVEGGEAVSVMGGRMVVETALGPVALPLLVVEGVATESLPEVVMAEAGAFELAAPFVASVVEAEVTDEGAMEPRAEEETAAVVTTLIFSTYHGGSNDDRGNNIDVDKDGNSYVVGTTASSNFPKKAGYDTSFNGGTDVFVSKYSSIGILLNSTYLGGDHNDQGEAVFVERESRKVYLTGTWGQIVFVAKLNSSLGSLPYLGWFDGYGPPSSSDECHASADEDLLGHDITADANGNAYVALRYKVSGIEHCTNTPPSPYVIGPSCDIVGFDTNAVTNGILWHTFLGGWEYGYGEHGDCHGIALQGNSVYAVGRSTGDLPTTIGAYDRTYSGNGDGFMAKLRASDGQLVYSTYIGGSGEDRLEGIAVDANGIAYAVGSSTSSNFPQTSNAFRNIRAGNADAVLMVLNATGSSRVYATYLGGTANDSGQEVAIDTAGNAYIVGTTLSTNLDTKDPYQATKKDGSDAFLAKLQVRGSGSPLPMLYGTYWGGSGGGKDDSGESIALDASGFIYMTGSAKSKTGFPLNNAQYPSNKGLEDAFVSRLALAPVKTTSFQDGVSSGAAYAGTRDTYVSENSPSTNFGAVATLNVDGNDPNGSGKDVCTLIKWDIGSIPTGAALSSAKITINVLNHSTGQVYELYRVKQNWNEMAATWNNQPTHDTKVLGTVGMNALGPYTINLNATGKSVVQGWVDAPATNYGFWICDSANTDGFDFDSSEAATAANRPKLTVQWVHPAVTTSASVEEPLMEEGAPEAGWQSLWLPLVNR